MADTGEARQTARDAVVRPLSRAAGRPCARPGCPSPARATLSFRYGTREAWLEALGDEPSLATYDLCSQHADRTRPPTGWGLVDRRPAEDTAAADVATVTPDDIGGEHTVAVLAAALRAVPSAPSVRPQERAIVEQPALLDDEVASVLAELQAVAAVASESGDDTHRDDGDELDEPPVTAAQPRPVPAAREREHREPREGAARSW